MRATDTEGGITESVTTLLAQVGWVVLLERAKVRAAAGPKVPSQCALEALARSIIHAETGWTAVDEASPRRARDIAVNLQMLHDALDRPLICMQQRTSPVAPVESLDARPKVRAQLTVPLASYSIDEARVQVGQNGVEGLVAQKANTVAIHVEPIHDAKVIVRAPYAIQVEEL